MIKKDEPQIHLQVDNQVFVFPKDVDTEVANHYIDKIFESLQEKNRPQRIYVIYNKKRNKLEEYTEEELIQREIRKHAKKSH